jgi:hypothetical protein
VVTIDFDKAVGYRYSLSGKLAPIVAMRLSNEKENSVDVQAYVDTGAEFSLFRADYLNPLGLNLLDGDAEEVSTLVASFPIYRHIVRISLFDELRFNLRVGFSDLIRRDLLGRDILDKVHFAMREHHRQMFFKLEQ